MKVKDALAKRRQTIKSHPKQVAVVVVAGGQTVHHDATGHYETVESGGHWE